MNFKKIADWFLDRQETLPQRHVSSSLYPQRSGYQSYAGISPSQDLALTLGAVWGCVRRLSETIATMPIQVFERLPSGGTRQAGYEHPLSYVLHDSPNFDMTAIEFWQAMQCAVELWGNAYAVKQMAGAQLVCLDFLRPACMRVRRLTDGRIEYRYSDGQTQKTWYDNEVLHIKGMTLDGVMGLSTISYMANTVGLSVALEQAAGDVFKNGLRPSGIFNIPHQLKEGQRREAEAMLERFKQDRNGGILTTGLGETFSAISIKPEDAQLLSSRSWAVEDVCRWFGVPPYLVGYTEKSTSWGTGMEQQNAGYLMYTILPRIRKIEQAIEKTLIPPEERRRYFVRFNYEGLL